ncbi:chloramphenicol acetyltransferase (CAT-III) [Indibacter alkaliphilus LW1]|uniref:Chloramphenicol acetyltransferase (CAT-III) n=1 Tax=Indibacter alkaliphilus (strain CCUG 57479 / KCTC 22604 / LW1) TaxID=1189612 RepID=S2DJ74_INDAL|nr:chloramphenicol acetyltransferase (CAT-III) [Indibacter alkaliphilus LW1]
MYRKVNIEKWSRKDHFLFFSKFEEPFFGICTKVDCTRAFLDSKQNNSSFFLRYLHDCLKAANVKQNFIKELSPQIKYFPYL